MTPPSTLSETRLSREQRALVSRVVGAEPDALGASVARARDLFREVAGHAGDLYHPRYAVPR